MVISHLVCVMLAQSSQLFTHDSVCDNNEMDVSSRATHSTAVLCASVPPAPDSTACSVARISRHAVADCSAADGEIIDPLVSLASSAGLHQLSICEYPPHVNVPQRSEAGSTGSTLWGSASGTGVAAARVGPSGDPFPAKATLLVAGEQQEQLLLHGHWPTEQISPAAKATAAAAAAAAQGICAEQHWGTSQSRTHSGNTLLPDSHGGMLPSAGDASCAYGLKDAHKKSALKCKYSRM
jgi:hypothetical protein